MELEQRCLGCGIWRIRIKYMHRRGLTDDENEKSKIFWLFRDVARISYSLPPFDFVAWTPLTRHPAIIHSWIGAVSNAR